MSDCCEAEALSSVAKIFQEIADSIRDMSVDPSFLRLCYEPTTVSWTSTLISLVFCESSFCFGAFDYPSC